VYCGFLTQNTLDNTHQNTPAEQGLKGEEIEEKNTAFEARVFKNHHFSDSL
jgi:hypothetical protein